MRAVVYSRVSTDDQVRGYSLDKQEEECMKFIQTNGHEFVTLYCDDGYSAKDTNRPALQAMLSEIPNRSFDMIVVWNSDRLTRDIIDGLNMVKNMFNRNGIKFASVTEDIDTSSYDGMMMLTMRLMMAQRERERIGERVTMGLAKKASMGRRVSLGGVYGYDVSEGKLIINEDESETVRDIFNWYVYKSWGYGKIADTLNTKEVPAKKTVWYPNTIKGILGNNTYIGMNTWTPKNQEPVIIQGEHDRIITDELFYIAQTRLKRRREGDMSRSSHNYPFSSIVKCGACGASYHAYYTKKVTDNHGYSNYRCANKKPGICKAPDIAERKLEKLFFDFFRTSAKVEAESYSPEPTKDEMRQLEKEKNRIEKEIAKLENRKTNLLADLGDRIISRDDYKESIAATNESLSRLRQDLDMIVPQEVAVTRSPNEVIEFIYNLQTDWEFMNAEDRKFILQMMFKRIVIQKDKEWMIKEVEPA